METPDFVECTPLSAADLASVIRSESQVVRIIDVRPFSAFSLQHVKGALGIRLSSLLVRRLLMGKIAVDDLISNPEVWRTRSADCLVVCYDDDAAYFEPVPFDIKNPLHIIMVALQREGASCVFLHGGLSELKAQHPELLTDQAPATSTLPGIGNPGLLGNMLTFEPPTAPFTAAPKTPACAVPSQVLPHLLIGSKHDAANRAALSSLGITYVLNLTPDCPNYFKDDAAFSYLQIPLLDTWNQKITDYFSVAFEFLDQAKQSGSRCLVHCTAGISRSAAFAIAYIMKELNMSLKDAYTFVKARREIISPNLDFMGELKDYEARLTAQQQSTTVVKQHVVNSVVDTSGSHVIPSS